MFVDEGFGSLAEDSLQEAIKALAGLTKGNRLLGIISHVAELKEKIDKQIVVTNENPSAAGLNCVLEGDIRLPNIYISRQNLN